MYCLHCTCISITSVFVLINFIAVLPSYIEWHACAFGFTLEYFGAVGRSCTCDDFWTQSYTEPPCSDRLWGQPRFVLNTFIMPFWYIMLKSIYKIRLIVYRCQRILFALCQWPPMPMRSVDCCLIRIGHMQICSIIQSTKWKARRANRFLCSRTLRLSTVEL